VLVGRRCEYGHALVALLDVGDSSAHRAHFVLGGARRRVVGSMTGVKVRVSSGRRYDGRWPPQYEVAIARSRCGDFFKVAADA
jgi:hypothetical protein